MCSVILLRRPDATWPLILGANRDEMAGRPWKAPARHWPDRPNVIAGLDELAGGSWLGMNDEGVVAAVLNRMGTLGPEAGKRSRGELVLDALDFADAAEAAREIWAANSLLDKLGLFTTECYQQAREEVIRRQQQELLELSTPVVRLWNGVLALPLIGTLDSARTQVVMESLLKEIMETGSEIAIIDITGVPMVDTLVAQHLLKTVAAARLMGADCIISGIRPQIAQTIVHLGVNLADVVTKATLEDAFRLALQRSNLQVVEKAPEGR